MKRVLSFLRPQAGRTVLQIGIKFTATILELILPWILEHIIDEVAPTGDKRQLLLWGSLMVLCALSVFLGAMVANRMAAKIAANFTRSLRHVLFARVTALSCEQADRFTVPSLISRLSSDTYRVNDMVDRMLRLGIRAPILLVGGMLVSALMEPVLALILISAVPLVGGMFLLISRRSIPLYGKAQQAGEELVRRIQENMTGVRIIKALSRTEDEKERFAKANGNAVKADRLAETTMAVANPAMSVLLNMGMAAVIVVGAFRVDRGLTEPGKIIAFLNYFVILQNGLLGITRIFTICSRGIASGKRLDEVLEAPERVAPPPPREPAPAGHVVFSHVSFSYNKVKPDLSDLSFTLRRAYTMVLQDTWLFHGTIRENIAYGKPDATEDEIVAAARAAMIHGYIQSLPQGYDTLLSDNAVNLSKGQKQLLTIARAILIDSPMLILDEATSNVDTQTERQSQSAMLNLMRGRTCFVIAHRLCTIQNADEILVMDAGAIVERGTHRELLTRRGVYYDLYSAQFQDA